MRVPTDAELDRWAAMARSSGTSAEGGQIVRFGAVDLLTYPDGVHLRLLTPYPALLDGRESESPDQPVMFERTPEGEIVFHLGGLTDAIQKVLREPTASAEVRLIVFELLVQITYRKADTLLLPADTDTIEVSLCDDEGRQWMSEALPPDLSIVAYSREDV